MRFARLDDSTFAVRADATPPGRSRLMLEAALGYAEDGIPVLPVKPNAKVPLTGNGLHAATLDRSRIERWWRDWPDANLAMVTGAPGYNVLDVDVRLEGSGMQTFEQLKRAGLLAGILGLARTPSGGLHAFFPGTQERCSKLSGRHIDFKAAGGYVLASPSHVVTAEYSGDYAWLFPIEGEGTALDWPRISSIYEPTKGKRTSALVPARDTRGLVRYVRNLPEGGRNNGFHWAACEALRHGHTDLSALRDAALSTGLDDTEVDATLRSALRERDRNES